MDVLSRPAITKMQAVIYIIIIVGIVIGIYWYYSLMPARHILASVKGRIVDNVTREGLKGALVSIYEAKIASETDQSGSFTLENIPPGIVKVEIKKEGYVSIMFLLKVREGISYNLGNIPLFREEYGLRKVAILSDEELQLELIGNIKLKSLFDDAMIEGFNILIPAKLITNKTSTFLLLILASQKSPTEFLILTTLGPHTFPGPPLPVPDEPWRMPFLPPIEGPKPEWLRRLEERLKERAEVEKELAKTYSHIWILLNEFYYQYGRPDLVVKPTDNSSDIIKIVEEIIKIILEFLSLFMDP